jgi:hypothetical protein
LLATHISNVAHSNYCLGSANDRLTEICTPGSKAFAYSARTFRREAEAKRRLELKKGMKRLSTPNGFI